MFNTNFVLIVLNVQKKSAKPKKFFVFPVGKKKKEKSYGSFCFRQNTKLL
jgi:hypothetical protein